MKRWLLAMASLAMVAACSTGEPAASTAGVAETTPTTSAAATTAADRPADDFGARHDGGRSRLPGDGDGGWAAMSRSRRAPSAIASLSATHTEVLFALGCRRPGGGGGHVLHLASGGGREGAGRRLRAQRGSGGGARARSGDPRLRSR